MKLLSVTLDGEYKGLRSDTFDFSQSEGRLLAFIGLNGSGKSQLLELIAESFAFLERKQRVDFKTKSGLGFSVVLFYQTASKTNKFSKYLKLRNLLMDSREPPKFKVEIFDGGEVLASVFLTGEWENIEFNKLVLPEYVVGYSSGLNENLQRSFMKNAVQFHDVMNTRLKRRKELSGKIDEAATARLNRQYLERYPHIFDAPEGEAIKEDGYLSLRESVTSIPLMLFMDYDCSALLLASFCILPDEEIKPLLSEVEFKIPKLIQFRYNLRGDIAEEDAVRDIKLLIRAGGEGCIKGTGPRSSKIQYNLFELDYLSGVITLDISSEEVKMRLSELNYGDPLTLFKRLFRLQLLGVKLWEGTTKTKLRKDNFFETVKKPLKSKLPLSVERLELANEQGQRINFDDFSDGEAQLIQILAAARIFRNEETLFLFDEPETHLNPSWRTYFHQHLTEAFQVDGVWTNKTQTLLSTHSPFMISSLKKSEVYQFKRDDNGFIRMSAVTEQTYGASFDVLIKQYFGLKSLISQSVVSEIREKLKLSDEDALAWINENLGSSPEKAYLQRKLSQ